jgi:hypothetical protein
MARGAVFWPRVRDEVTTMNSDPLPFRNKQDTNGAGSHDEAAPDDATEVTLDSAPVGPGRVTERLPPIAHPPQEGLLDVALDLFPSETRQHLRAAGRETALMATSLAGGLLKGLAVTLNAVAEVLNDYTTSHSTVNDLEAARRRRQRVDIEVE